MDLRQKIVEVESLEVEKLTTSRFGKTFEVYPWIKSRIFHKLVMGTEVLQEKTGSVFKEQLRSLLYGFFSFFRRYDAWAFTSSSERILLDGRQVDKVMDPLAMNSKLKVLVVELQLFKRFKRREVASKHVVSRAWIIFLEEFYMRLFLRNIKLDGEDVLKEIETLLGEKVETQAIIRKYLAQYRVMKFMLWLLPKPKVIFHTVSYANFGYIRAWKDAGIRVVEMQHGLIGESHYGYVYHKAMNSNQFPDDVLVFGELDKEILEQQTKMPLKEVVPVGRYVLDYYKDKAKSNIVPIKDVLVSLQDSEWSNALLNFVLEVNKLEPGRFNWIIQTRRTPEAVYRETFTFPENVSFSTKSVYQAMSETDAHLTIFSTTAIESLSIGKPTFLFNFENAAVTYLGAFLASNPNVYFCESAEEFVQFSAGLKLKEADEIAASNVQNVGADYKLRIGNYLDKILHEAVQK